MCCYHPVVAEAAVLPLAAGVCHRVPDDAIRCCSVLHLIPVFSFPSFKQKTKNDATLGSTAVACTQPRFTYNPIAHVSYILENYGHTRSQGGRQSAAAKLPVYVRADMLAMSSQQSRPGFEP